MLSPESSVIASPDPPPCSLENINFGKPCFGLQPGLKEALGPDDHEDDQNEVLGRRICRAVIWFGIWGFGMLGPGLSNLGFRNWGVGN